MKKGITITSKNVHSVFKKALIKMETAEKQIVTVTCKHGLIACYFGCKDTDFK